MRSSRQMISMSAGCNTAVQASGLGRRARAPDDLSLNTNSHPASLSMSRLKKEVLFSGANSGVAYPLCQIDRLLTSQIQPFPTGCWYCNS